MYGQSQEHCRETEAKPGDICERSQLLCLDGLFIDTFDLDDTNRERWKVVGIATVMSAIRKGLRHCTGHCKHESHTPQVLTTCEVWDRTCGETVFDALVLGCKGHSPDDIPNVVDVISVIA